MGKPPARIGRGLAGLGAVAVLAAGGLVVSGGTAHALGGIPCGPDMRWPGNTGEVTAQLGPTGFIQWGARDYVDNSGRWVAWVLVGRRMVDFKDQAYQPHGRVNPKDLRSGQLFSLTVMHINSHGKKSFSRPDANCVIP